MRSQNDFPISHSKHALSTQKTHLSRTTPLSTQNTCDDSLYTTECVSVTFTMNTVNSEIFDAKQEVS